MTFSTLLTPGRRTLLAAALLAGLVGCATRPVPADVAQTPVSYTHLTLPTTSRV